MPDVQQGDGGWPYPSCSGARLFREVHCHVLEDGKAVFSSQLFSLSPHPVISTIREQLRALPREAAIVDKECILGIVMVRSHEPAFFMV